jgi:ribonuclease HI
VQAGGSRTTKGRGAASSASGSSNAAAGPSRGREKRPGAKATELVPTTEDADGFMRTAEGRLVVYTDGGCIGNGKRGAKAGLGVYYGARSGRNLSEPVPGPLQTNNRGELLVRSPRSS